MDRCNQIRHSFGRRVGACISEQLAKVWREHGNTPRGERLDHGPTERLNEIGVVEVDEEVHATEKLPGIQFPELQHLPCRRHITEYRIEALRSTEDTNDRPIIVRIHGEQVLGVIRPLQRTGPAMSADHRSIANWSGTVDRPPSGIDHLDPVAFGERHARPL